MQQLKFDAQVNSKSELIKSKKSAMIDELLTKEEIREIVKKLDVSMTEFDYYLGYFLSFYEDKCFCKSCENMDKCSKEVKGTVLNLFRNEDNKIEREFNLCPKKEEKRKMDSNYLIRDFNDSLLKIDLDNVQNKKGRFKFEKMLMEIDLDSANEGLFVYGASSSGKSYPLIALCNEFVKNNKKCSFVDVKSFIASLQRTFDKDIKKDPDELNFSELMDMAKKVDVLVLDNLGEENQSEWVRDTVIGDILDYRNQNSLLTFITSCYTLEEIEKMYNVSKSNSEVGKIKASKFVGKIKVACKNIIKIETK